MQRFTGNDNGDRVRTLVRLLLWLLPGAVVLVAALAALLWLVDVNLYRGQIERHVSAAFGRDVVFEGPLGLERSLAPRFTVEGLKVANPQWASRPYLATAKKFAVRVALLPLVTGKLEIVSLEFDGVDLRLEKRVDGSNNFRFGESTGPAALPLVEHLSLHDVRVAYLAPEIEELRLHLSELAARKLRGQALELEAHSTVNGVPLGIWLRGEPSGENPPRGLWQASLLAELGKTTLRVESDAVDPNDWDRGAYRVELLASNLDELGALAGLALPDAAPLELGASISFDRAAYAAIEDLSARLGDSDVQGRLRWDFLLQPPVVRGRLDAQRLDAGGLGLADTTASDSDAAAAKHRELAFDVGTMASLDLDVELKVERLEGLSLAAHDIAVRARADRQQLNLAVLGATLDEARIEASARLPWGAQLAALAPESIGLPALIEHAELDFHANAPDSVYRYVTKLMGSPLKLSFDSLKVKARPGTALSIEAQGEFNQQPLSATLESEPLAALLSRPAGPWRDLTLKVRGDTLRLDASGSVAQPFQAEGFDIGYSASGDAASLPPVPASWSLSGRYRDQAARKVLVFEDLALSIGRSDLSGQATVQLDDQRPRLITRLTSERLQLDELLPEPGAAQATSTVWEQPLAIGGLAAMDLDLEFGAQRLEGLAMPLQDLRLHVQADRERLTLAPLAATLDDMEVEGRFQIPWGEGLVEDDGELSARRLLQKADIALSGHPPPGGLRHRTRLVGQPVDLELGDFNASARPGQPVQLSVSASFDERPVQVKLRAEPLSELLRRPTGPWRKLVLDVQGNDLAVEASGSIARPLEAGGFDIRYAVRGAEVATLLPLFNLMLPIEGAFTLTGHFADLPGRLVFDDLNIRYGDSDINGRISVYQGEPRPRLVADLYSEQMYLSKLIPVSETETAPGAESRVIPDYDLPVERLREMDGELSFRGKRLRTTAGDLGDISFKATLRDAVLELDPFRVRGWAGARIESSITIDARQDPPHMSLEWIGRELNYGVLLEQAGFAETVEGTLDVTLRLAGEGRTRREFLSSADGQLIVVGERGRFGSRRLDLWGSALVTTMLSSEWRREDVTELNCIVARIGVEDGVASSDKFIVDTPRITIAATGTLDLESEGLNLIIAPRPKRTTLLSLANPVQLSGTLAAPEVDVTVLPRNRVAAAGTGMLAGLINPGYLIFTFAQTGGGRGNSCATAVAEAMALKGTLDPDAELPRETPRRFSLLPGCTRAAR
jgi:uncharacterized protein involved in outer membrane biogenesis